MGWPWTTGVALGAVISAASTMVLGRLLIDRGILKTETGSITIGISLVDDMAVVVMIVLLPVLASLTPEAIGNLGLELGRAFLILAPAIFLSSKAIPWLLSKVHSWGNKEFLFIFTISLPIAMAAFTEWLGLSLALGAFLGGLLISNAPEGHDAAKELHGVRDLCVAVFFVSVGAMIDPGQLLADPTKLLILLGLILVGKSVVWTLVIRVFGSDWRTSFRSALYLSQIGEFSFILVAVAVGAGLLTATDSNAILAAALLSILANSLLTKLKV
jgi:CPA2 family monovalent cation:H+ antiporter-2